MGKSESRSESQSRIGFLGPSGTFTEQALRSQPDLADMQAHPMRTFVDVLHAVRDGELEYGFCAIENAIEGVVNVTLDTLAFDVDLVIQREVVLDIHMELLAQPGTHLSEIRKVVSHPVAHAQCREFVRQNLPDAETGPASSTADAARIASEVRGIAAIGPAIAGTQFGLEVLASDIADHSGNQTRFILVTRDGVPKPTGHDKTTVVLTQREDRPGSLVSILQEFAARTINLSRLTSRPVKKALGDYCFIIDFDGHIADDVVADCLRTIRAKHADVKFLGSYADAGVRNHETRNAAQGAWAEAKGWMDSLRATIDS